MSETLTAEEVDAMPAGRDRDELRLRGAIRAFAAEGLARGGAVAHEEMTREAIGPRCTLLAIANVVEALARKESEFLRAVSAQAHKERDEARVLLEGLTPGGSEFHNDPERCARYAQEARKTWREAFWKQVKRRKDAEAQRDEARAEADAAHSAANAAAERLAVFEAAVRAQVAWERHGMAGYTRPDEAERLRLEMLKTHAEALALLGEAGAQDRGR